MNTPPPNTTQQLESCLTTIDQTTKDLEAIKKRLTEEINNLDGILPEQNTTYEDHCNKYVEDATNDLAANGIELTNEEKEQLRRNLLIPSTNKEQQINELAKRKVSVPKKASNFATNLTTVVVAALSRMLKKVDDAYDITKKLPAVKKEQDAFENVMNGFKKQYEEFINRVKDIDDQREKTPGLPSEELDLIAQTKETFMPEIVAEKEEAEIAGERKEIAPTSGGGGQ